MDTKRNHYRARQGMVFWLDPAKAYKTGSTFTTFTGETKPTSIQLGNRLCVVLSSDELNVQSNTVVVAPITSKVKMSHANVRPAFVVNNVTTTVLLDQIKTVDAEALDTYVYSFTEDTMDEIFNALKDLFGHQIRGGSVMHNVDIDVADEIKPLEESEEALQPIEDQVSNNTDGADTADTNYSEQIQKEEVVLTTRRDGRQKYDNLSPTEKFKKKYHYSRPTDIPNYPIRGKGEVWTLEQYKCLVNDYRKLPEEEMFKKYSINGTHYLKTAVCTARRVLEDAERNKVMN